MAVIVSEAALINKLISDQGFDVSNYQALQDVGADSLKSLDFLRSLQTKDLSVALNLREDKIDPNFKEKIAAVIFNFRKEQQQSESPTPGSTQFAARVQVSVRSKDVPDEDPLYKYIKKLNQDFTSPIDNESRDEDAVDDSVWIDSSSLDPTDEEKASLPTEIIDDKVNASENTLYNLLAPPEDPVDEKIGKWRAGFLDWQRAKAEDSAPVGLVSHVLHGKLWKRTQKIVQPWVQREFKASVIAGTISYTRQLGADKCFWVVEGCEVHLLHGSYDGRPNCIRISWPSHHDLIISTDTELDCKNWFDFLESMIYPPHDIHKKRSALVGHSATQALIRASIRSHKSESRIVSDPHHFKIKAKATPKDFHVPKVEGSEFDETVEMNQTFMGRDARSIQLEQLLEEDWSMGHPYPKYTALPEHHHSILSSENKHLWSVFCTDFPLRHQEELRRFLVAYNFNIAKATYALRLHIAWRAKNFPVRPQTLAVELGKSKCFVKGYDYHGHPVLYYILRLQDTQSRNLQDNLRMIIYRMEQAISCLPMRDGKITIVIACDGAKAHNWDNELLGAWAKLMKEHYPGRLFNLLVAPVGNSLRLRGLGFDSKKEKFLKTNNELLFYISPDQLLEQFGGQVPFSVEEEIRKPVVIKTGAAPPSGRGSRFSAESDSTPLEPDSTTFGDEETKTSLSVDGYGEIPGGGEGGEGPAAVQVLLAGVSGIAAAGAEGINLVSGTFFGADALPSSALKEDANSRSPAFGFSGDEATDNDSSSNQSECNGESERDRDARAVRRAARPAETTISTPASTLTAAEFSIPILRPRLWTSAEAVDYYPPPIPPPVQLPAPAEVIPIVRKQSTKEDEGDDEEDDQGSDKVPAFMCDECASASCKSCTLARQPKDLLDGWTPIDFDSDDWANHL